LRRNHAEEDLPRIAAVTPGRALLTLRVRWEQGGESVVDVSGLIGTFRAYAPLRKNRALFWRVSVGQYGTDVVWTDAIDMAADTLWRLAQEQSGATLTDGRRLPGVA
jgi:hypothetical protein